ANEYGSPESAKTCCTAATPTFRSSIGNHGNLGSCKDSEIPVCLYQCPKCSRSFRFSSKLRSHLVSHSNLKPYKCDFCPVTFKWLMSQEKHTVEQHWEELQSSGRAGNTKYSRLLKRKILSCQICGKRLSSQAALDAHAAVHTGECLYVCQLCKCTFKHPSSFGRHSKRCRGCVQPTSQKSTRL
ncbi:zinc finger protein 208, partial [Clonorchis sinensis]